MNRRLFLQATALGIGTVPLGAGAWSRLVERGSAVEPTILNAGPGTSPALTTATEHTASDAVATGGSPELVSVLLDSFGPLIRLRRNARTTAGGPEWTPGAGQPVPFAVAITANGEDAARSSRGYKRGKASGIATLRARVTLRGAQGGHLRGIAARADQIIGNTAAQWVREGLAPDAPNTIDFEFDSAALAAAGVGVHDVAWRWEYAPPNSPVEDRVWAPLNTSRHRLYAVLTSPGNPWENDQPDESLAETLREYGGVSPHWVWTEVLDQAVDWARGAKTREEVAARVTKAVYSKGRVGPGGGPPVLRYDSDGAAAHYTTNRRYDPRKNLLVGDVFYCEAFLERMKGAEGRGALVNCFDCAAAVLTFANALGCELSSVDVEGPRTRGVPETLSLRPVTVIGESASAERRWIGHAFAIDRADALAASRVYDASLALAGEEEPRTGLKLGKGRPGDGSYLGRLFAGRAVATPDDRIWRVVPPRLSLEDPS